MHLRPRHANQLVAHVTSRWNERCCCRRYVLTQLLTCTKRINSWQCTWRSNCSNSSWRHARCICSVTRASNRLPVIVTVTKTDILGYSAELTHDVYSVCRHQRVIIMQHLIFAGRSAVNPGPSISMYECRSPKTCRDILTNCTAMWKIRRCARISRQLQVLIVEVICQS